MNFSSETSEPQDLVRQVWFLRVRFILAAGGLLVVIGAGLWGEWSLPFLPVSLLFGVSLITNLVLFRISKSGIKLTDLIVLSALGFDVLLLTVALALSGGASNPFSSVYLLYIPIGALLLPQRLTWWLVSLAIVAYTALFWSDLYGHHGGHHSMRAHLVGMWVAFVIVGPVVAYVVARLRVAASDAEFELMEIRFQQARAEKLAALATLSAGAAHELSTPLGTIAIAAKELENGENSERVTEDARLIRQEIERCSGILSQLAVDVGAGVGEAAQRMGVSELMDAITDGVEEAVVEADLETLKREVRIPRRLMIQALSGILKNSRQASAEGAAIDLKVYIEREEECLVLEISDHGSGMSADVLRHVGEPFFTQKAPGQGMGLGVFFARSVVEQCGGEIHIASQRGEGTQVKVVLPCGFLSE